jgi:antirestriction protein ArdC
LREWLYIDVEVAVGVGIVGDPLSIWRDRGYIGAWLEVLKADKRAVFQAASMASKAADFVMERPRGRSKHLLET